MIDSATKQMFWAAQSGNVAMLRDALAGGANARARSPWDVESALHVAARAKDPALIAELLRLSDPLAINNKGRSALMIALGNGREKNAELLLGVSDWRAVDNEGLGPVHYACESKSLACLEIALMCQGPDGASREGEAPLMIASAVGFLDGVRKILPLVDPNATDAQGRTALMRAAELGPESIVKVLLAKSDGALRDKSGKTAADWALVAKRGDLARWLQVQVDRRAIKAASKRVLAKRAAPVRGMRI